ncbi:S-layer homology domain-containing protein [Thermovenabulum sp.]|uniref:S-layer homology domain-containing protein n=1 Tax=Thermovenabulum sp. TaxID=3100335 RepID=UPI003C7D482E
MKRVISLLLVIILLFSLMPIAGLAQDEFFQITLEKIIDDQNVTFKITTNNNINIKKLHYILMNEQVFNELMSQGYDFIKSYLLSNDPPYEGIFMKGHFNSIISNNPFYYPFDKQEISSRFDKNTDKVYFLCIAETEDGQISNNYVYKEIIPSEVLGNVVKALENIDSRITKNKALTIKLIDILNQKNKNELLKKFLNAIQGTDIEGRLNNLGINERNLIIAHNLFKDDIGYTYLKEEINKGKLSENEAFIGAANTAINEIFKQDWSPLKLLYNKIIEKFGTLTDFLRYVREKENYFVSDYKDSMTIKYENNTVKIYYNNDLLTFINNQVLTPKGIATISSTDITNILSAFNAVLAEFTGDDAKAIAEYFKAQGYNVVGLPTSTVEPGGGTGGGGGAPSTSKTEETIDDKKAEFKVNITAAKITESQGKAIITFDSSAVNEILKAFENTAAKASGKEFTMTLNLASSDIKTANIEANIPKEIFAKAFEKGATVKIMLNELTMDLPKNVLDVSIGTNVKIEVKPDDVSQVINTLTNYKLISTPKDIVIKIDDKQANINGKVTLRFSIKGLTTNIDKLGLYFVDKEKGTLQFIGGKVDKQNSEIIAKTSHFSTYAVMEYNKTFDDITSHWAKNYIESLASKYIVNGKEEKKFDPEGKVTRAEFTKMILNALEIDKVPYSNSFEDVKKDTWYADYVETAYRYGIIKGKVEGKVFDPNGYITRQEIFAILARAMKLAPSKDAAEKLYIFKDYKDIADYAKEYTAALIEQKIVSGYEDMTVRPKNNATRAEAAKLIYEIYNR